MYLKKIVQGIKYTDLRKNWKYLRKVYFDEVRDLVNNKVIARFFKLKN